MEIKIILSAIGTLFNAVGLILIYKYGISPLIDPEGQVYLYSNDDFGKGPLWDKQKKYKKWSRYGLFVSILGMILTFFSGLI
ncbi:MAG: hypothetical protein ACP5PZ_12320 [Bacteroidales bacterium]